MISRIEAELARLERNMDRREQRERAKGLIGSPSAAGSPGADLGGDADGAAPTGKRGRKKNTEGTARKCANCGQIGHIKTNKKLVALSHFICQKCLDQKRMDGGDGGPGAGGSGGNRKRGNGGGGGGATATPTSYWSYRSLLAL